MATLKQLMTLLNKENLLEERKEIIENFTHGRTCSAKNLNQSEIDEMCFILNKNSLETLDKKRKRLIASIFGVFGKMNKTVSIDYVKGIACRAAKVERFNDIPPSRLDSLYNAFLKAQKDLAFCERLVKGYISEQQSYN